MGDPLGSLIKKLHIVWLRAVVKLGTISVGIEWVGTPVEAGRYNLVSELDPDGNVSARTLGPKGGGL